MAQIGPSSDLVTKVSINGSLVFYDKDKLLQVS